jgi:hypothetical protein
MTVTKIVRKKGITRVFGIEGEGSKGKKEESWDSAEPSVEFLDAWKTLQTFANDLNEHKDGTHVNLHTINVKYDKDETPGCTLSYNKVLATINRPANLNTPLVYVDAGMTKKAGDALTKLLELAEKYAMGGARQLGLALPDQSDDEPAIEENMVDAGQKEEAVAA